MFGRPPFGRPKYGNKRTVVDGIKFSSKREARRYEVLRDRQAAREISMLRIQTPFRIEVGGVKVCYYRSDFTYMSHGRFVVEDVKGMKTDVYKLKKRLMLAVHGIVIQEV